MRRPAKLTDFYIYACPICDEEQMAVVDTVPACSNCVMEVAECGR